MTDFLTPDILLILITAGIISGFLAGLLGIGGGIVTVPAQVIVYDYMGFSDDWKMHIAVATSLAIIILTSASSVWAHHKKGGVDWSIIRDWVPFVAVAAVLGSFAAKELKTIELVYMFVGLGAVLALKMLLPLDHIRLGSDLPTGAKRFVFPFLTGFLSSILGIGGGSFSVPYLSLYNVDIKRAVGTSSMIGFVIAITGAAGFLLGGLSIANLPDSNIGLINIPALIVIAGAAVFVAPLGAKAAHKLPKRALSIIFGLFLVIAISRLWMSV